ncbi:MAG: hypothetical protein PVH29_06120 [Candidatus Zixiibacteriota bacterium]|jgi:hypothetical protein
MNRAATYPTEAKDLTQVDVYELLALYGGSLTGAGRSKLNSLLEHMSYPEELVGDVRVEAGNRLYFAAKAEIETMLGLAAAGAPESPPPDDRPTPRSRKDRAQAAVIERAAAAKEGAKFAELIRRAKEKAKKVEV